MFGINLPISKTVFPYTRPFLKSGAVSVPLTVTIGTGWLDICAEQMTQQERGIICMVGADVADNGSPYDYVTASLAFQVAVSGGAPQGWSLYTSRRGSINFPTQTFILVEPGNKVQFQVRRANLTDTGPRSVDGIINGIRWSSTVKDIKDDPFLIHLPAEVAAAIVR